MIFNIRWRNIGQAVFFLICLPWLMAGAAYSADLPVKTGKSIAAQREAKIGTSDWKKVLESAKKEGKLVLSADPSEEWRKSLVDLFRQDYPEITVEYTGITARDFWPRFRREQEMGQRLWDLRAGGTTTAFEFRREGFLDPIRPLLLPENADNSKWVGGLDGLFYDKEKKFMPAYTLYVQATTSVNRDFIKELELKSSKQLVEPRFKGKIVIQTPSSGATFQSLGALAFMYGKDFVHDLLVRQNLVVTNDKRQQAEWLVRGKYPIAIGFIGYQLLPFLKEGLGKGVTVLEDKIIPVAPGVGGIVLLRDAPHPNAAKVYINWLLSKSTQIKLSKNVQLNSLRTDVPPVDEGTAVDPAQVNNLYNCSTEENTEISQRLLPMIKEALKY